jgi:acyl-CoA thioesterase-1
MLLIIIAVFVVLEVLALIWLATSVNRYHDFWIARASDSGKITYLALGDSAAQGIGATSPMRGYVGLIAIDIENRTGKTVRIINLSKTGAKMDDYLKDQAPVVATLKPDVVTIEIGANDVANFNATEYRAKFKQVLATLPSGAFVSNMPLFNSRPGSTQNAKLASAIIEEELRNYPTLNFFDLQTQTQQNQSIFGFAPDLFHPNNLSYKNWAAAFLNEINKASN